MTRLEAIIAYRQKKQHEKVVREKRLEEEDVRLRNEISKLKSRIKDLCDVANECRDSGINIDYMPSCEDEDDDDDIVRMRGAFYTIRSNNRNAFIGFFPPGIGHITTVGFGYIASHSIICEFETNGSNTYVRHTNASHSLIDDLNITTDVMATFLSQFDAFEKAFYEYIDDTIDYTSDTNEIVDGYATFELQGPYDQGAYVCSACGYGNNTYGFKGICEKCGRKDPDERKYR